MAKTASDSISVVIPVFNGAAFIDQAVASVRAQTLAVGEIIIVDDGSTDDSVAVAQRIEGVQIVTQANAGPSAARNHGARLARGEWLAFLDADDLWSPDKLRRQMAAFDADPELGMAFGHALQFRQGDAPDSGRTGPPIPAFLPSALLMRRGEFGRVGGYCSDWTLGEVVEWYARALDRGLKGICLPEVVLYRRIHGDNLGVRERGSRHHYARALKMVLDRRRAAGGGLPDKAGT